MSELNIHQRLLEVRKSVKVLSKDAKNTHQKFDYVSSSNVLSNLKAEMDKQGLLLVPSVESSEVRSHETKQGGNWFFTILNLVYTWVNVDDPKDTVVCKWLGCGLDSSELGVGKGLTYGEKYFLLKFFNIPTDGDDPDSGNGKKETTKKTSTKSDKDKNDKLKIIRECLGDIGRWHFEEQQDGSVLRYKVENQKDVNVNAINALKRISAFPGKDGKKDFEGFDSLKSLENISDKWLNSVYGNVQAEHKAWKEKFDNSTETKQSEDDDELPF